MNYVKAFILRKWDIVGIYFPVLLIFFLCNHFLIFDNYIDLHLISN